MSDILDACQSGDVVRVRAALATDPNAVHEIDDYLGSTPLIFAAHRGFLQIVELLLEAGADVEKRERVSETTAVHWVAERGDLPVLERLVRAGARLDVIDGWFGLGPLGWASVVEWAKPRWADRPAVVRWLLDHGAVVDPFSAVAIGKDDALVPTGRLGFVLRERTPLHVAVSSNRAMVAPLLAMGADPHALDSWGTSPLALAILTGHREAFGDIALDASAELALGEDPDDAPAGLLCFAAELDRASGAQRLITKGARVDETVRALAGELPSRLTALHIAAEHGNVATARVLIAAGANLDARAENTDQTPLHRAVASCKAEMIHTLLQAGADASLKDAQFCATPRGWAEFGGEPEIIAAFGG